MSRPQTVFVQKFGGMAGFAEGVAHAHAAHEALPGSRLVVFESSGHFPHTEEPESFVEALTDFIDTSEALELAASGKDMRVGVDPWA